jgi:hypothetical protein
VKKLHQATSGGYGMYLCGNMRVFVSTLVFRFLPAVALQKELYGKVHCHDAESKIHMSHQIFALHVHCAA